MRGFFVTTVDENDYTIGSSGEIVLDNVSLPNSLSYVTIGYDGAAQIGSYANLIVNVGANQSLGQDCYVGIYFPDDFTLDSNLERITGTGMFTGLGGSNTVQIASLDY
jgi:hypothetical protein